MSSPLPQPACLQVLPWSLRFQGGVNEVVKSLIRHLNAEGHLQPAVMIATTVDRSPEWDARQSFPVLFEELNSPWIPERRLRGLLSFAAKLPFRLCRLRSLLRKHKIRIVHAHYPFPGILHFSILRSFGAYNGALVLSFHLGDAQAAERTKGFERFLWKRLLRSADRIISPSTGLHDLILAVEPSVKTRLITINNGVDFELFSQRPEQLHQFPQQAIGRPVVISVGNFEERKGHQFLIRAFAKVRQRHPGAVLIIVGALFPYIRILRSLIEELGLRDCAFLIENVPHELIPAYLSRSSLFVLATQNETFPLAILEAAAAGLPVISNRAPGVVELITHGVNGRLVPVGDVDALAQNMIELMENPAEARRLAGNLREHVRANLTWDQHFRKHRRVYAELLGEASPEVSPPTAT